jgi:hypothetical protein
MMQTTLFGTTLFGEVTIAITPAEPIGFTLGMDESAQAAKRWTDDEKARVDDAIALAASRGSFTSADVWHILGTEFKVTKGMASRLNLAATRGVIRSTGMIAYPSGRDVPNHGQRLTVWEPLGTSPTRGSDA